MINNKETYLIYKYELEQELFYLELENIKQGLSEEENIKKHILELIINEAHFFIDSINHSAVETTVLHPRDLLFIFGKNKSFIKNDTINTFHKCYIDDYINNIQNKKI